MKRLLILVMAGLSVPLGAAGRIPSTLGECIGYAMEHNLRIQEHELSVRQKETAYTRARLSVLPSFALYGSGNFNWGRSVDMQELVIIKNKLSESVNLSVGTEWTIFHGLSGQNMIRAAKSDLDATLLDNSRLRNEISLSITETYLELILSEELAAAAENNYERILSEKKNVATLVKAGSQPGSALYNMESQCAGELSRMIGLQCDNKRNIMKLAQLLNLQYDGNYRTVRSLIEELAPPPSATAEEILTYAEHRPDILSLKRTMESKKHLIAAAKGTASPTFSLSGAYSSYFSSTAEGNFGKQLENNVNPSVGISVNIPLFDGFAGAQRIRDSKIEYERARILVEKQLSELSATIQGAFIESENRYQAMLAAKEKMASAEKLMDVSLSKFKHGNITAIEYTVSRTDFLSAQSEYLRCKWQYIFQLKIIDYYRGIPIEL